LNRHRVRGAATDLATRYRAFLRLPDTIALMAVALVARMPIGMLSLALLMHLRDIGGSFATAGALVGGYLVASALAAPVLGRIIDRRGPRGVLRVTGTVQPAMLLLILFARPLDLKLPAIAALAVVAGAFMPPISVLTRTLWRHRFGEGDDRHTAFSVDAVLVELNFTLGPALIALLLATTTPAAAFAAAVFFATIAAPLFLRSPAQRYWRRERAGVQRHLLGPLTDPRLLHVYAITLGLAFALGLLEVGYPGFATGVGAPALGGVLIAINSAASAVGGLAYGGLGLHTPVERQLPRMLALLAVPIALHAFVASPWLLVVPAIAAGLLIAPSLTAISMLVAKHAPARYATEAFTWSMTSIVTGIGAGMATGGLLLESRGPAAAFALGAASALACAVLALRLRTDRAGTLSTIDSHTDSRKP
jgi:MFS family permease